MDVQSYRELKVLEALAADETLTQRHLAKRLQVALGLANLLIRRFVKKGYVKIVNIQQQRIRYLLTPKGIAEKTRLTYDYLEYSLDLYRGVRRVLKENLLQLAEQGRRNIVVIGTGEVAEIAYVTLKELGLNLVGVADHRAVGQTFLGLPVLELEALTRLEFDCGIVGWLDGGLQELKDHLAELGIPSEKILLIEQQGPRIHAILQPTEVS